VLLACRPSSELIVGDSALRVSPAKLDFGVVALNTTATRTVELQNTGASPLAVQVRTRSPFDADPALTVGGGSSTELAVRFTPMHDGDADGELDLLVDQSTGSVPLHGRGATCPPIGPCQQPRLDGTTCVLETAPDGTACTATCLENATCVAGECVGSARSCDDGDACTVDSCDPAMGCVHSAMQCPSAPCGKPTCDAQTGCGLEPVADGTSCGDAVCAWADVCIDGACERKATPNADLECQYQDVVATGAITCAVNRAGHVRCWGGYDWSALLDAPPPQTVSPPTTLSGFSNEVLIAAYGGLCGADSAGDLRCGRADQTPSAVPAPLAGLSLEDFGGFFGCQVSSTGEVSTWVSNGAPTPLAHAPVKEAVISDGTLWLLDAMGNIDETFLSPTWTCPYSARGPVAHLLQTAHSQWGPTVLYADGSVDILWNSTPMPGSTALHGPGAVAVGASSEDGWITNTPANVCVAESGGHIICQTPYGTSVRHYQVPGEVVKLTSGGDFHVCALNDRGDIWCWGDNIWGQLDDSQVVFEPHFFDKTVSAVGTWGYVSDGGLYSTQFYYSDDGGTQWSPDPAVVAQVGDAQFVGQWGFLLSQGVVLDRWTRQTVVSGIARCDGLGELLCNDTMSFEPHVACVDMTGNPVLVGKNCIGGGVLHGCLLNADGTVDCLPGMTRVALPGAASRISASLVASGGCAILAQGGVRCWSDPTATPQPIPGLQPGAREIEGDLAFGCALTGPRTVQCWGVNAFGQLGQRGPSSPTANVRTFDEPIVHLAADVATVCVQLQSGRAACWGQNEFGLLGRTLWRAEAPLQIVR
jgi:hypothetical protein